MNGCFRVLSVLLTCWLLAGERLAAQTPSEPATETTTRPSGTDAAEIKALQSQAAANADLSEEHKARAEELAQQALADLQAADTFKKDAARYSEQAGKVSQHLDQAEQDLGRLENEQEPSIEADASVSELETERNTAQQRITELEQLLGQPSVDPTARTARRRAARSFLIDLPNLLQQVKERLEVQPPEGEPVVLTNLRHASHLAERQSLQEHAAAAQAELSLFDAEDAARLPTLWRELLTRQLTRQRKLMELYAEQVNRLRQQKAALRVREARDAAMRAQPLLKPILEANEQIASEEAEIRKKHEGVQQSLQERKEQLTALRDDFQEIQQFDKEFGLSASVGLRLRKLRSQLPNLGLQRAQRRERFETLEKAQFSLYERNDELNDLKDIEAAAAAIVTSSTGLNEEQRLQLRDDALAALRTRHDYLDKLVNAYSSYTETLARLDINDLQLIKETRKFAEFVDERVLWVRSHRPLSFSIVLADGNSIAFLWDVRSWQSLGRAMADDISRVPWLYGAVGALLAFLLVLHQRMGRRLRKVAKSARSRVAISMLPTIRAAEYTVLVSLIWPGLMWFIAWRLWQAPDPPRIVPAVAVSLNRLAGLFLFLELLRQSLRPLGLCETYFGWPGVMARRISRRLRRLMIFGLPLAAALAVIHFYDAEGRQAFVERMFFIALMMVLVYLTHGLLHPRRGDLRELQSLRGGGWIDRLGIVWYLLGVGLPLLLAGFAAAGYYYTAQKLALRCQVSVCLLLGLIYVRAFLLRWLMLRYRRLRLEQLRVRQPADSSPATDEAGSPLPGAPSEETDLDSINRQSRRLVSTTVVVVCLIGVWMIWSDVLPALRFFDQWPLWEYDTQLVEETTNALGDIERKSVDVRVPVTIAHLALVTLIFVLTITAARNLPGLLEITLLQRLPIDHSTTYAITALVRYSLVLIGILLASRALGVGWSKVQWLAAALTFGLGFGLQEIFANFVSGIIILFEQPVRVGDVVTIDGISGVVNRIRIRATTIVDWDRKEYIVPNREFITGRLLNWTLSDKLNRVVVNVGVAYGSDTALVRETILAVAREHKNVLDDPAPLVTLEGFGESALDFVLRAYLPNLDARLQTTHDLHMAIDNRLKAAGIEIPFPQRDLHLRTSVVLSDKVT